MLGTQGGKDGHLMAGRALRMGSNQEGQANVEEPDPEGCEEALQLDFASSSLNNAQTTKMKGILITAVAARALLSAAVILTVSELAKRNNFAAAIVHSLPLISLTALMWLFYDTRDTALIARHAESTFWFVLPTLPFFLLLAWMLRRGFHFWSAVGVGVVITVALYFLTSRLLSAAGHKF